LLTGLIGWAVVAGFLFVLPLWRVFDRAGLNPNTAFLALIPFAGLPIALGMAAFKDWPKGEAVLRSPFDEFDRVKEEL